MIIEVENFLPIKYLDQLVNLSNDTRKWTVQEKQGHLSRQKIFNPIHEILCWFNDHPLFNHLKFTGYTVWKDAGDFSMDWHMDNERVKVAVQIYLDDRDSPGTQFKDRHIRYGKNRGYILFNNAGMEHCVPDETPHEGRLSVYALYEDVIDENSV